MRTCVHLSHLAGTSFSVFLLRLTVFTSADIAASQTSSAMLLAFLLLNQNSNPNISKKFLLQLGMRPNKVNEIEHTYKTLQKQEWTAMIKKLTVSWPDSKDFIFSPCWVSSSFSTDARFCHEFVKIATSQSILTAGDLKKAQMERGGAGEKKNSEQKTSLHILG